jgi:hypothetical protein
VHSFSIVKQLDIVKQTMKGVCFGLRNAGTEVVEALRLDGGPEGFAERIVIAVAFGISCVWWE